MKNAYDAGMRGGEEPKPKAKAKKNVRRITVEPAKGGGRIVRVEHHPPKAKKGADGKEAMSSPFGDDEPIVAGSHEEAMDHLHEHGQNMATQSEYEGEED
jgi:hypothetical protein